LAYLEEHRRVVGPHLIVTDKAANWSIAMERFLPHAKVFEFADQKDSVCHRDGLKEYFCLDFARLQYLLGGL
jgi:hypothetical protein